MSHVHRSPEPPVVHRRVEGEGPHGGPVQIAGTIMLAVVWMVLWGRLDIPTLLMGLVLGVVVFWVFPLPRIQFAGSIRPHWWCALIGRFAYDLVVASVAVAWAAVTRGSRMDNAVIRVPLRTDSDFVLTQVVEFTSLVPGSVVLETRRAVHPVGDHTVSGDPAVEPVRETNTVYVHVMDLRGPDPVEHARRTVAALEARVIRAFGTAEDYRLLRAESNAVPEDRANPEDRTGGGQP